MIIYSLRILETQDNCLERKKNGVQREERENVTKAQRIATSFNGN